MLLELFILNEDVSLMQESFGTGGRAGDALIMPADVINRWFVKFSERYRRDPDFFTRSVSKI